MEIVHFAKNASDVYACGKKFGLVSSIPSQVTCRACKEAAQHRMHLTAFGARLAWLFFGFILLLAMVLIIIGGR